MFARSLLSGISCIRLCRAFNVFCVTGISVLCEDKLIAYSAQVFIAKSEESFEAAAERAAWRVALRRLDSDYFVGLFARSRSKHTAALRWYVAVGGLIVGVFRWQDPLHNLCRIERIVVDVNGGSLAPRQVSFYHIHAPLIDFDWFLRQVFDRALHFIFFRFFPFTQAMENRRHHARDELSRRLRWLSFVFFWCFFNCFLTHIRSHVLTPCVNSSFDLTTQQITKHFHYFFPPRSSSNKSSAHRIKPTALMSIKAKSSKRNDHFNQRVTLLRFKISFNQLSCYRWYSWGFPRIISIIYGSEV